MYKKKQQYKTLQKTIVKYIFFIITGVWVTILKTLDIVLLLFI